uniref:Kinesin motor domain-containing protein n=1 Tax=Lotharella oceanica TaxID=641309 RepID=A0A7S2X6K7_9EUKA|mmetsp:Transcript_12800/g.24467  ORF Transcript_12800/g.24467 Transcript_12800/m.24467 type:complete len:126 (+) Transcript_12800:70-447(+)
MGEPMNVCLRFCPLLTDDECAEQKIAIEFKKDPKTNEIQAVSFTDEALAFYGAACLTKEHATFSFDRIFHWKSSQESVYEQTIAPMIADVFKGINCTVLTYGSEGTGKSFSLMGTQGSKEEVNGS